MQARVFIFDGPDHVTGLADYGPNNVLRFAIDGSSLADAAAQLAGTDGAEHVAIGFDGHPSDTYDTAADLIRDLHNGAFSNQACGVTIADCNSGATSGPASLIIVTVYYREPIAKP